MVKRSVKETLFFILVAVMFFLSVKIMEYWKTQDKWADLKIIITGIILALILMAIYYWSHLHACGEGFWEVSPAARCKGGPYMWQGDSETAKMCREMASSDDGKCKIASYNCPKGYIGQPRLPFYYTPLSGDDWRNERCDKPTPCKCVLGEGPAELTAFERLVPFDDLTDSEAPQLCDR